MKKNVLIYLFMLSGLSSVSLAESPSSPNIIQYDNQEFQEKKFTHFTSGTGFFVSNNYIITSEHVVQGCKNIKIRGAIKPSYARIQSTDKKHDLALLRTSENPVRIAQLRGDEIPVNKGEAVTVMGFPLNHGITGDYMVKKAVVTEPEDVYDGIKRVQFTDSVEKGNSGGPLLDDNGNVIGVIAGKMSFYLADATTDKITDATPIKTSSMAVSLKDLRAFLQNNNIYYRSDNTRYNYPDKWMENKAKDYIVNVHCLKE